MADLYSCKRCGTAGIRKLIPYKIIRDDNGESIKFMGQLCENCFEEIFDGAPTTKDTKEQEDTDDTGESDKGI